MTGVLPKVVDGSLRKAAYIGESLHHQLAEVTKEYAAVEKSTTLSIAGPSATSRDVSAMVPSGS
jgi:hypothetical protein